MEQLINTYYDYLYISAMRLARDTEKAKDLRGDTIVRLLQYQSKFDGKNFKAWSATVMYNTFINQYRAKQSRVKLANVGDEWQLDLFDGRSTKNEAEERLFLQDMAQMAKDTLNDKELAIWKMYIIRCKYEEIAKQLGLPSGTVRSKIYHIRRKLRTAYKKLH